MNLIMRVEELSLTSMSLRRVKKKAAFQILVVLEKVMIQEESGLTTLTGRPGILANSF